MIFPKSWANNQPSWVVLSENNTTEGFISVDAKRAWRRWGKYQILGPNLSNDDDLQTQSNMARETELLDLYNSKIALELSRNVTINPVRSMKPRKGGRKMMLVVTRLQTGHHIGTRILREPSQAPEHHRECKKITGAVIIDSTIMPIFPDYSRV